MQAVCCDKEQNISVATTETSKYCRTTLEVLGILQAFHLPHLVREPPGVSQNKDTIILVIFRDGLNNVYK